MKSNSNVFLKYTIEDYVDNDHLWNVRRFIWDVFGYNIDTSEGYEEVRNYITYGNGIRELGSILDRHNLIFNGEEQLQEFIDRIMSAKNNTRIWKAMDILLPCGSGKKYKKCCARFDDDR